MKALVTGGTGFLGRHLVPDLERRGIEMTVLDSRSCDMTVQANLAASPDIESDRIYPLAAWTKAGDFCLYHMGEQWIVNQQINTNALWHWRERPPQATMVAMGTSCAYPPEGPLCEDMYMGGGPDAGLYTYAMSKRMLYQGLRALNAQFGMSYRHFVPSTLFGPDFDHADFHFIFDLIKKIVAGKRHGDPNVVELARTDGVETLHRFFDEAASSDILAGMGYSAGPFTAALLPPCPALSTCCPRRRSPRASAAVPLPPWR